MKMIIFTITSLLPLVVIVINIILYSIVFTNPRIGLLSWIPGTINIGSVTLYLLFDDSDSIILTITSIFIIGISILSLYKKHFILLTINICSTLFLIEYTIWFVELLLKIVL